LTGKNAQEDQEGMAGADGQRVVACEGEGGFVIARPAHQLLTRGLAEGQPEADTRNRTHQRLVEVFHSLDEMRLAKDEIGGVRLDDRHHSEFHDCTPAG
jgi:hypothetical protein